MIKSRQEVTKLIKQHEDNILVIQYVPQAEPCDYIREGFRKQPEGSWEIWKQDQGQRSGHYKCNKCDF